MRRFMYDMALYRVWGYNDHQRFCAAFKGGVIWQINLVETILICFVRAGKGTKGTSAGYPVWD